MSPCKSSTNLKKNLQIVVNINVGFLTLQTVWAHVDKADYFRICAACQAASLKSWTLSESQGPFSVVFLCSWLLIKVRPVCFVLSAHPVWWAWVIPVVEWTLVCRTQCRMWVARTDTLGLVALCWETLEAPRAWARRWGTAVGMWPQRMKCQPSLTHWYHSQQPEWLVILVRRK